jgi:glycosyltransferase involved in cell wall biosynthesis
MISVLTLTYQRHHLLEEAIYSFLSQDYKEECEMIVLNDSPDIEYVLDHPNVKIINHPTRFSSIGKKLEYGFKQCNGDYIYRLDDDDLLAPWALALIKEYQQIHPNKDIYRCQHHYFFTNNQFISLSDSINNGNCYSKSFIENIEFPDVSGNEDNIITFWKDADIYTGDTGRYSMIYRWGMGTYHISGMGDYENNEYILSKTDSHIVKETGTRLLDPHFKENYYQYLYPCQQ